MKNLALPLALAMIPAAFLLGAKNEPREDQTAVLLRIERILLQQSHLPEYGRRVPFNHNPLQGTFCDGAEFCSLYDQNDKKPGKWREKLPGFLDEIEKAKGKEFRARFEAYIAEQTRAAEPEKK